MQVLTFYILPFVFRGPEMSVPLDFATVTAHYLDLQHYSRFFIVIQQHTTVKMKMVFALAQ